MNFSDKCHFFFKGQQTYCTPIISHFSETHYSFIAISAVFRFFLSIQILKPISLTKPGLSVSLRSQIEVIVLSEYFCPSATWGQILNWQLILKAGIVY